MGGLGADRLVSDEGADWLWGGTGDPAQADHVTDQFVYYQPDQGDMIFDFDSTAPALGGDILDLSRLLDLLVDPQVAIDDAGSPGNTVVAVYDGADELQFQVLLVGVSGGGDVIDNLLI